ncbi:MAG: hypothetical protein A3K19_21775 [Lentisphaerae bacterium RIFOXYB12_FULL_65_16]|nr:MAG: hypothetical protein A3K18_21025 [Lentisphaerae bacterium RIFOXYA12_64_32]OGV93890.1 MAG: hypothetical protein A3K19_21775 [Lentisphaerae bacterium RIFOXYB12_FULL_65_16]
MCNPTLNAKCLLEDKTRHRLVLQATLAPVCGDRIQPAGFPEIGHVIYKAPRPNGTTEDVCIVDSAASMANHLEAVCHASPLALDVHEDLAGLPLVQCLTGDSGEQPTRLVVTSLSEGHRLASSYFTDPKAKVVDGGRATERSFVQDLLLGFGMPDLGKKTHPLPTDWWSVFGTIFRYDPNSLVHGIMFPSLGIKIPRVLTPHHEATGAARVGSSGVKFDKLGKTTSGQPIFAVDEETAREIRATFVLDLALVRSFGRATTGSDGQSHTLGLSERQKQFLIEFAFWKIHRLLSAPFRFRSNCDLQLQKLVWVGANGTDPKDKDLDIATLGVNIREAIKDKDCKFTDPATRVTKVYWPSSELFKAAEDKPDKTPEAAEEDDSDEAGTNE